MPQSFIPEHFYGKGYKPFCGIVFDTYLIALIFIQGSRI